MLNLAVEQEEIEESRLPTPRLDFTSRIRSILDGDNSILSPNTEVLSIPGDVLDMDIHNSIQDDNNDGLVQNTSNAEGIVEENNGNPGNKTESTEDDQVVETFFGLETDKQAQVLVSYKSSIHKLSSQNKELLGLLETVNKDDKLSKTSSRKV